MNRRASIRPWGVKREAKIITGCGVGLVFSLTPETSKLYSYSNSGGIQ